MRHNVLALTLIAATGCATSGIESSTVTALEVTQVRSALREAIGSSPADLPTLQKSGQVLQLIYSMSDATLEQTIGNQSATLELRALSSVLSQHLERPISLLLCASYCAVFRSDASVLR